MIRIKQKGKTEILAYMGVMVAVTVVCSQISVPLPFVPINLGLFAVLLAGALLGPFYGTLSICCYVLLGLLGVPVFAGFKSGLEALGGSTGGYIIGYIFSAAIAGFASILSRKKVVFTIGLIFAVLLCYIFGTIWFMVLTEMSLEKSLLLCVIPFIPGDAIKIIAVVHICGRLEKAL